MNRSTKLVVTVIVLCAMGAYAKSKTDKTAATKKPKDSKIDTTKAASASAASTQSELSNSENSMRRNRQHRYRLTNRNLAQELAAAPPTATSTDPAKPSAFITQVDSCLGGTEGVNRILSRIKSENEAVQVSLSRLQKKNRSIQKKLDTTIESILNGALETAPPDNRCFLANLYLQSMVASVPGLERGTRAKLIRNQLRDNRNQQLKVVDRQLFALQTKRYLSDVSTRRAKDKRDDIQFFARKDISNTTKLLSLRKPASTSHKK